MKLLYPFFSDVSHTRLKDDKPVLLIILNEEEWSSSVLRSVPVNEKCTAIILLNDKCYEFSCPGRSSSVKHVHRSRASAMFQVTPEMFDWLQFRVVVGPVKNFHSCPPDPPVFSWLCVQSHCLVGWQIFGLIYRTKACRHTVFNYV